LVVSVKENIQLHTRFSAADVDEIVRFHKQFVAQRYGLNAEFEMQVRTGLTTYLEGYDAKKDCVWLAEDQGQLIGTVGVMHESDTVARVRWLLAHPDYRDALEKELLEQALTFCQRKYKKVYLLAATLFERLAPLAQNVGFQKVEERQVVLWGQTVTDERYELELLETNSVSKIH
jgi:RimJ/RimL family protein N-acetyltransferase